MVLIKNKILPFGKRFNAINLFSIILYKGSYPTKRVINHEAIHTEQLKDLLYIFYYPAYLIAWIAAGFSHSKNCFEREAKLNDRNMNYIKTRKRFSWIK